MLKAVIFDLNGISCNNTPQPKVPIPYLDQLKADLQKNGLQIADIASIAGNSCDRASSYSALQKQLQVHPGECVAITDTYWGLLSARNASVTCIGYHNPDITPQDLYKASFLVEGFEEVDFSFIDRVYQYDHMHPVTIATTHNFIIRELSVDDVRELHLICNEPSVRPYVDDFNDSLAVEMEKQEAYIRNVYHFYGFGLWGVFLKETNQLVGRCGIEYKQLGSEEIYEIGYLLAKPYQGLGYAREFVTGVLNYGFRELRLPRIVAVIDKENIRSIHLAEQVGMQRAGACLRNRRACYKYEITGSLLCG